MFWILILILTIINELIQLVYTYIYIYIERERDVYIYIYIYDMYTQAHLLAKDLAREKAELMSEEADSRQPSEKENEQIWNNYKTRH